MTDITIEDLSDGEIRSMIAQLGEYTPDVYYYSQDLGPDGDISPLTGLMFISRNLTSMIPPGEMLKSSVYGLDSAGEPYGDWAMEVECRPLDETEEEYQFIGVSPGDLDRESIRKFLSEVANATPLTVYHDSGRFERLGEKTTNSGEKLGDPGFATMVMARCLRDQLEVGQSFMLTYVGQPFGSEPGNIIRVEVTRLSAE